MLQRAECDSGKDIYYGAHHYCRIQGNKCTEEASPPLCVISAAVIPCFSVARVVTNIIGHNKETPLHPAAAHGLASLLTHHSMKIAVLEKSVRDNGVTPCRACVVKLGTV